MKFIKSIICLFLLPYYILQAQTTITRVVSDSLNNPVENYLLASEKTMSRDQVFVHLDKNMYRPGDTIYFQAYIRDRFTNTFKSGSASLYAILFDHKQVKTDSARFRIDNSTSSGWMTIPATATPGKYHFAAFTGSMQNFDPLDAFQIDLYVRPLNNNPEKIEIILNKENYQPGDTLEAFIKITDSKGQPVNQQEFQSNLTTDIYSIKSNETRTNKKGESLIRFLIPDTITRQLKLNVNIQNRGNKASTNKEVSIPFDDQYFELRFLPEGGVLVSGLKQRIGFNATNFKGEPVYIEGLLKNSSGSILDTIRSGNYGPGQFFCVPQPGMYVELLNSAGRQKIWPLPDQVSTGKCLSVKPLNNRSFAVEIQSGSYKGETVIASAVMNTTQIFYQELVLNKRQRIVVETDQLPSGVAQITLFNKEMRPVAERLFYINADKHLKFDIKTDSIAYNPGKETELKITVTDGQGNPSEGIFSIAVVDSVSGHNEEIFIPGIEYTYNYHPNFPGHLPSKVLNKGLENLSNEDRDLLLMVYGWRRYNWDFGKDVKYEKELINYDLLNMKILYALKKHRSDRRLDLVSLEGPSIMHLMTNSKGEISLPLDSLPVITRSVTMMPNTGNKKRVTGAMLNIPYNEQYFKSNKLLTPQPEIPEDFYRISPVNNNFPMGEGAIEIPEVTITGHPENKIEYQNKYEEIYQNTNIHSLAPELLRSSFSLADALNKMRMRGGTTSLFGKRGSYLIVLDDMALYPGYNANPFDLVSTLLPTDIASLSILDGISGCARYGEAALHGVIFINTFAKNPSLMKIRTKWTLQDKKDNMLLPISIYRSNIEFYNPTNHESDADPVIQSRSTIFWDPEVYFNGKEPVRIKYTNLKRHGPVVITINGVSVSNLVGTGRAGYQVF